MKILIVLLMAAPIIKAADPVNLELFPYAYFQGQSRTFSVKDCVSFGWIGSYVASAKLHDGSCVKMFKSNTCAFQGGCDGKVCHLAYPKVEEKILSQDIYHNLNSAKACDTSTVTVRCPNGTWVRRMDFANDDLRSGITIRCYEPGNKHPTAILNTHGRNLTIYSSQYCEGPARGVRVLKNSTYKIISKAEAICKYSTSIGSDSLQCAKTDALVGITVVIEELSNVIKSIKPICKFVEDPATVCTPTDSYVPIVVCDNTLGFTPTTCQYTSTEGVGISKTLSEKASLELKFYGEMGIGAGIETPAERLEANFEAKLGFSAATQFEWSKAATTTWSQETSIQVSIETPAGVITKLEQVVGKCSFYEVNVNYFRRIDRHGNATKTTVLPVNMDLFSLAKVSMVVN